MIQPFLFELAEEVNRLSELSSATLVFPNRRAALYFRKHLSSLISKPVFAPTLYTFEDFVSKLSPSRVPEKLELISILHRVYTNVLAEEESISQEPFEQFYSWGQMLLKDFDEVDKYMVNAKVLFQDLSDLKELDERFDFLNDEQKQYLKDFWGGFENSFSGNKKKFLSVWKRLFTIYTRFKEELLTKGIAYEGMLHGMIAEQIKSGKLKLEFEPNKKQLWFVGFNALTAAEEVILSYAVENNLAEIRWDVDQYYLNDDRQESGKFFREHKKHAVFQKTFSDHAPDHFRKIENIEAYAAAQPIAQAKWLSELIGKRLSDGMIPEETVIVLPDEKLLMPVLHSVSGHFEKINVTMGFSLTETPIYNLIELLIDLQISARNKMFNHRTALSVLEHPYVSAVDVASTHAKRKEIINHNWVMVDDAFLKAGNALYEIIFQEPKRIIWYLIEVVEEVSKVSSLTEFDKEFILVGKKCLNRLATVIDVQSREELAADRVNQLKSFLRLFRQVARGEKIPFSGEPLKGVQIMGVLETRNLDFKNVFVLSLNEGSFPSVSSGGSYIPFSLRRAYNLPTQEHQGAIYSYLFYRLLQRAEHIHLFYNSETDVLGQGEMSRYLQQLIFESGLTIRKNLLHNSVRPKQIQPIQIVKDERVLEGLARLNEETVRSRGLSPSAINTYFSCKLKFYFKHIAKIKEPKQVEEEIDARVLGNILHLVMESFYRDVRSLKRRGEVTVSDFDDLEKKIDALIDRAFIRQYRLEEKKKVTYEGQRVIVREVVKDFVSRILEADKAYAPFEMIGVEQNDWLHTMKLEHEPGFVVLNGKIDRVDVKEGLVRVIDYKTGKDKIDFKNVESLFGPERERNKAAFQTLLYALLFLKNNQQERNVLPCLISRSNVYDGSSQYGLAMDGKAIENAAPLMIEFEERLKIVLEEIFDPEKVFDQTDDEEACRICPYREICYR